MNHVTRIEQTGHFEQQAQADRPAVTSHAEGAFIRSVKGVFNGLECEELIDLAERLGFDAAPVTTSRGFVMMPELRNNTRVILDDSDRAAALWAKVSRFVPQERERARAAGLNERFRFYRYGAGEYFRWHRDGAFVRDGHEQSELTALVYLNGDCEGGSTDFDLGDEVIRIHPERGLLVLFDHRLRHQGAPVTRGRKYVLRSDVMYRRRDR